MNIWSFVHTEPKSLELRKLGALVLCGLFEVHPQLFGRMLAGMSSGNLTLATKKKRKRKNNDNFLMRELKIGRKKLMGRDVVCITDWTCPAPLPWSLLLVPSTFVSLIYFPMKRGVFDIVYPAWSGLPVSAAESIRRVLNSHYDDAEYRLQHGPGRTEADLANVVCYILRSIYTCLPLPYWGLISCFAKFTTCLIILLHPYSSFTEWRWPRAGPPWIWSWGVSG